MAVELQFRCYLEEIEAVHGMRLLDDDSVDIIATSPPYNMGTDYDYYEDDLPRNDYLRWIGKVAKEAYRILKPNGSFFLNFSGRPRDRWLPHEVVLNFNQFHLQNEIHWIKSIAIEGVTHGQFKPINSPRYLNDCHEYLWHFTRGGNISVDRLGVGVVHTDLSNHRRWKAAHRDKKHCRGNCLFQPYPTRQSKLSHPATFPVSIPEYCLRLHGLPPANLREEILVLDPFVGTGSTAIAALNLGCKFVGFDLSPNYLTQACYRIEAETRQPCLIALEDDEEDD